MNEVLANFCMLADCRLVVASVRLLSLYRTGRSVKLRIRSTSADLASCMALISLISFKTHNDTREAESEMCQQGLLSAPEQDYQLKDLNAQTPEVETWMEG